MDMMEKTISARTVGAAASAVLLTVGAAGAMAPVMATAQEVPPTDAEVAFAADAEALGLADATTAAAVDRVEGQFSFDQAVVSDNGSIAGMFSKAAAVLCEGLPVYEAASAGPIAVTAGDAAFDATVDEMAAEDEAASYLMGCACSTNGPGGGAIMNAEVQGVALSCIATLAQVF